MIVYKAIVSHPSRENFPGNEGSHGGPREISVGAQCSNGIDSHMLSDTLHPSQENFPGDENSNGAPRAIPVGEQCSEFKSIEAEERGAFCIGFRKRLEFKTLSWQEETAEQVCLYERIPGTPQPSGVMPLALKHTASLSRPPYAKYSIHLYPQRCYPRKEVHLNDLFDQPCANRTQGHH